VYHTHSPTAVLPPRHDDHHSTYDGRRAGPASAGPGDVEPTDVVRAERDEVQTLRTEREAAVPFGGWLRRARAAGHPVQGLGLGRYRPDDLLPLWSWAMPPNDLLDAARETARREVDWFHAVLPDQKALLLLHRCVVTPPPRGRRRRPGGPTATPWPQLVAQQEVGLCAISDTRAGVTTHVLEIPVVWLACAILRVGPPLPGHRPPLPDHRPTAG
jgi:hypothetical protein